MTESHETQQEIWLSASCERQIAEHLFLGLPYEVCGILRGSATARCMRSETFVPMRNAAPDPLHRFILHPEDWTRECLQGDGLIGLFHSHPHSDPVPSAQDLQQLPLFAGMLSVYLIGSPGSEDHNVQLNGYNIIKGTDGNYTLQACRIMHD
ncbi:Mov34/MPN/PAD-1 family protein [Paenibacillus sp. KQZ6P-2]|uniref:Mov34/MPN/PAD-1 family protein n=1 Tax=Paenibacillus mangrovi TaxID=2931978 RepID=A0A9X2B0Z4_9BACL|nr:Mov34/MPN/PAD-1 family protein [Paenibacillus mangrovi]MCJ8010380.1 Mov34/MPN/PAD-1 family protein [Paenibacillus mangrovi]